MAMASRAQLMRSPADEQHVHLALGRVGRDLAGEREELVGGVAARRDHGAHAVALLVGGHDAARHVADARGVGDRRATVFLDDDGHEHLRERDG